MIVVSFYHFAPISDPAAAAADVSDLATGLTGSILVAPEGINGALAGPAVEARAALDQIRRWPGFAALASREAPVDAPPFTRLKVKLKREIVTFGPPVDPTTRVGTYVPPADWDALCADPGTVVIDTRNDYEVAIGRFRGAVDPGTDSFRDFPAWWQANAAAFAGKRVAMYCTGGIRCEKATSWLLDQGVPEVLHLKGGILAYLAEMPGDAWEGDCFVFDDRVSVGPRLIPGPHTICPGCRRPLAPEDRTVPGFEEGVSCHRCIEEHDAAARARFRERQRQIRLAAARGARHMGP